MELAVAEYKAEVGKLPSRCLYVRAPSSLRVVLQSWSPAPGRAEPGGAPVSLGWGGGFFVLLC